MSESDPFALGGFGSAEPSEPNALRKEPSAELREAAKRLSGSTEATMAHGLHRGRTRGPIPKLSPHQL